MATSNPRAVPVSPAPPRAFPIWPGACVGLLVACGLVGLESAGTSPEALIDLIGGIMSLAHAMVAFAVVTLIGEATVISVWERSLVEQLEIVREAPARDDVLDEPIDPEATRAEVELAERRLTDPWRAIRRICRIVAYVVPLIGFFLAAIKAGPQPSWSLAARPLLLGLGESAFVIFLSMSVSNSIDVVRDGWLSILSQAGVRADCDGETAGRST